MTDIAKTRRIIRKTRHNRVRRQISGTAERPRLAVRRSLNHIYAQLINDENGRSLLQISTRHKEISESGKSTKVEASQKVGKKIAELATEKGISHVVFDRGGFLYHGRVKALADAARESGLKF